MSITQRYANLLQQVLDEGVPITVRGLDTIELPHSGSFTFTAGYVPVRAGLNLKVGWSEIYQWMAQTFDHEHMVKVAPRARQDLFTAQMAYGPRMHGQIQRALHTLAADWLSRRVVIFIGGAHDQCSEHLPCTTSMQFLLRQLPLTERWQLRCYVTMRSWDAYRGLPYDVHLFGAIALLMQRWLVYLRVPCNQVRPLVQVTAGSLHLYTNTIPKLELRPWSYRFQLHAADKDFCTRATAVKYAREVLQKHKDDALVSKDLSLKPPGFRGEFIEAGVQPPLSLARMIENDA